MFLEYKFFVRYVINFFPLFVACLLILLTVVGFLFFVFLGCDEV